MTAFLALVRRDVTLALREGGTVTTALGFYLLVVVLLPLGLGPDLNLLARIAPGALWIALLLSSLLSADRIVHNDHEDGTLDPLVLGPLPLELVLAAKSLAHWIAVGLPLVVAAPLLALMLNLPQAAFGPLLLTLLTGTPAVSFLGAVGAGLTLGIRRGGALLPLLILPLYVPLLVFGVSATTAVITGPGSFLAAYLILAGLSLATLVLAPVAAAAAVRLNLS